MGLFSFIGGLLGGGSEKKGINKATAAQMQYLDKAIGEQQREYDTTRSDFMPYMDFGKAGLGPLGDLLGLNGNDAAASAIASLKASPLFQSLFNTGQEAVLQNASATGGVRGGNTQGALYELGSNTLAQVIQQQISNLFGAAGVGEGSTGAVSSAGAHSADAISALFGKQGDALASKYLAKAGINAQNWQNAGGLLDQVASTFLPMIPGMSAGMSSALGSLF
jgi:hypothetical protein